MSAYDLLLIVSALGFIFALSLGRCLASAWVMILFYAAQLALLCQIDPHAEPELALFSLNLFQNISLSWQLDAIGWFFALITLGAALLAAAYAAGPWSKAYREQGHSPWLFQIALALNVLTMLIFLGSADLLSLFIGWELVSWSSMLLMAAAGGKAIRYALRYMLYAFAGAMAVLGAMVITYHTAGSLQFEDLAAGFSDMTAISRWFLVLLFVFGFGIKMALIPFHLWQAPAYAFAPAPGAAFLGAISSRMGLFAIIMVVIKLIGIFHLEQLNIIAHFSVRDLFAWIAILTLILATFIALKQNDARLLLAWHGIGQGGYMLLGLLFANELSTAGGLMHVFNHASYQSILFLAVAAVIYRTGTADLNQLGGLVVRMPLSFLVLLIGIIGLAGLPPMNGFVSKLLIYRALIIEGQPLLFAGAVIGTLGTIMSVYKLIHNIFLGQLRYEHEQVREVPWSMMIPMLLMSAVVFITGMMPGLVLDWVAAVQTQLGLKAIQPSLGGLAMGSNELDMIWITAVLLMGFAIAALIFYGLGNPSKRVHQLDNYAGGHFLTSSTRYQYSNQFYAGLMHHIGSWYRGSFAWAEKALISWVDTITLLFHRLAWQSAPSFYLLLTTVLLMLWLLGGQYD